MRAYTVATVALTLGLAPKRLDNILTRFPVRGVVQSRQGVSRRLGPEAVLTLHIASELIRTLGMPLERAIALAERAGNDGGKIGLFPSGSLTLDLNIASAELGKRLALAVEVTPVPKRGRPSAK